MAVQVLVPHLLHSVHPVLVLPVHPAFFNHLPYQHLHYLDQLMHLAPVSPFSSSSTGFGQSVFSSPQVQGSAPVFSSSLFSSFAPPIGQAGAAFVHSTSSFGQTVSGFGQSSLFSTPSTGFGNFLTSTPSIGTSINPLGFSQTAVSTS